MIGTTIRVHRVNGSLFLPFEDAPRYVSVCEKGPNHKPNLSGPGLELHGF